MITKAQCNEMTEYLVEKLKDSTYSLDVKRKELVQGVGESDFILFDDGQTKNRLVLLVNKIFPGKAFNRLYSYIQPRAREFGLVFFKDGATFFRNAAEDNSFKSKYGLSLKNYSTEELHRMIQFRPEEIFLAECGRKIQYYQPKSPRLEEGLVTFNFNTVNFDYSHINSRERYKPQNTSSTRLFIWNNRVDDLGCPLKLNKNLVERR